MGIRSAEQHTLPIPASIRPWLMLQVQKQTEYLQIKGWLSTPRQARMHGARCTHEKGAAAKGV